MVEVSRLMAGTAAAISLPHLARTGDSATITVQGPAKQIDGPANPAESFGP